MKPPKQYLKSSFTCLRENALQLYYRDQLIMLRGAVIKCLLIKYMKYINISRQNAELVIVTEFHT
jgi:hypothetical protein